MKGRDICESKIYAGNKGKCMTTEQEGNGEGEEGGKNSSFSPK